MISNSENYIEVSVVYKAKEDLELQDSPYGVYAETGRPGWRVYKDGRKQKIGK